MGARIEPNKNIPNRGRDERHFRQGEIWIIDDQLIDLEERLELQIRSLQRRVERLEEELYETERLVERIEPLLIQEGTVDQILKRVAIVRDVLIDCDGYRVSAEALESLIEEVEEALTKILNGEEPYGVMVG